MLTNRMGTSVAVAGGSLAEQGYRGWGGHEVVAAVLTVFGARPCQSSPSPNLPEEWPPAKAGI